MMTKREESVFFGWIAFLLVVAVVIRLVLVSPLTAAKAGECEYIYPVWGDAQACIAVPAQPLPIHAPGK